MELSAGAYMEKEDAFYDAATNRIEWIDLEQWDRKNSFFNYLGTDFPYIVITSPVDVTKPLAFARENSISFNLVMVYLCNQTADSIKNFRYRFIDGKPFLIDHTRPTVNHIKKGEELFVIGEGPWPCDDIIEFCRKCHENLENAMAEDQQKPVRGKLDIINYTSIPWIDYTGFIRTIRKDGEDNAPKISFGKYTERDGRIWMPVSCQTHHGLMDGYHVGLFYERLQKACSGI